MLLADSDERATHFYEMFDTYIGLENNLTLCLQGLTWPLLSCYCDPVLILIYLILTLFPTHHIPQKHIAENILMTPDP